MSTANEKILFSGKSIVNPRSIIINTSYLPQSTFQVSGDTTLQGIVGIQGGQIYPPTKMTTNSTTISGQTYGNGTYVASYSTSDFGSGTTAWQVFDRTLSTNVGTNSVYNAGNPSPYGGSTTTVDTFTSTSYSGAWVQIQLPTSIVLQYYSMVGPQVEETRMPTIFQVFGSTNGSTWYLVDSRTGQGSWIGPQVFKTYYPATTVAYSYFRLVSNTVQGNWGQWSISEWFLYGPSTYSMYSIGGNVGIGTTSPSDSLHILGGTSQVRIDSAASDPCLAFYNGATFRGRAAYSYAGGYMYFQNDSQDKMRFYNGAGGAISLQPTAGNVGIGYNSPQSIVHVQVGDVVPTASGNMATGMIISQASGGPAMCLGARTTGGNYTWIHSAYTNNSGVAAPLVLQPIGGNVGIGTTSPSKLLHVWGGMIIGASTDSRATTVTLNAPGATVTFSQNSDIGDGARIMCLQCPDLSSTTANLVSFSLQVAPTGSFGTQRTSLDLKGFRVANQSYGGFCLTSAFDTGGSYDLFYADRTKAYFQQNVGIGTTSPSYLLDVNGQSRIGNPALITDASTVLRMTTSGGASYFQTGTALTSGSVGDTVFTGIYATPELMRIKSTGNVGIGITNPGSALQVVGTVTATTFSGAGTSLTGTAASLTAGNATTAVNQSGGTVSATTGSFSGILTASGNTNQFNRARVYSSSYGSGYGTAAFEMREYNLEGATGGNDMSRAPRIGFHWAGVVASSIAMEYGGRIVINNNPGTAYEQFASGSYYCSGTISCAGDITAFSSDERLKTKVGSIENALDKVCSLTAFKYTHNDVARQHGFTDDLVYVGLSAQEVQKVLPEVVKPAPFDVETEKGGGITKSKSGENYLTIQYERIVSLLVEAVKEERSERLRLQDRLERLERLLSQDRTQ